MGSPPGGVYMLFAQSLAVVDDASVSLAMLVALTIAVLLAVAVGGAVALAVDRKDGTITVLREG